ncbi:hypothetical protein [Noviherbaspirillum sp.]|nr:hypothetical protein [Noviherbaspirillum sp.]HZW19930.1 hypothetical protein [Noviherbaspirillum sp.]
MANTGMITMSMREFVGWDAIPARFNQHDDSWDFISACRGV